MPESYLPHRHDFIRKCLLAQGFGVESLDQCGWHIPWHFQLCEIPLLKKDGFLFYDAML